jgi:hypothetical protein
MLICNQDRDKIFEVGEIKVEKHYHENKFFGYNLYGFDNNHFRYLLGTFDEEHEAYTELLKLHIDSNPIKHITIY